VARRDRLQGVGRPLHPLDLGGIVRRADDDEVVVHDEPPVEHRAVLDVFPFERGRMREHDVRFPSRRQRERLTGSNRDRLDGVARLALEHRDEHVEQA